MRFKALNINGILNGILVIVLGIGCISIMPEPSKPPQNNVKDLKSIAGKYSCFQNESNGTSGHMGTCSPSYQTFEVIIKSENYLYKIDSVSCDTIISSAIEYLAEHNKYEARIPPSTWVGSYKFEKDGKELRMEETLYNRYPQCGQICIMKPVVKNDMNCSNK